MKKNADELVTGDDRLQIGAMLYYMLKHWWVLMLFCIVFGALGFVYSKIKSDTYDVRASIILNDTESDGKGSLGSGLGSLLSSFNMGGASYKLVEDEILRIQSRNNLISTIKTLNLNSRSWSKNSFFEPKVWYYNDSPVNVDIPMAALDTMQRSTFFKITVPEGGRNIRVVVEQPVGKEVMDKTFPKFPFNVKTPCGTFHISKSVTYNPSEKLVFYNLTSSPAIYAESLYKQLEVSSPSRKSNVINLSTEEVLPRRGVDMLNTLVDVYNRNGVETSHEEARQTVDFINERMIDMYSQLEKSEADIESYKRSNRIVDPDAEAEYILKKKGTAESALIEQQTRQGVLRMVIDFLKGENTKYSMIPFTSNVPEAPIQAYNELVLERMRLEQNVKGSNATLKAITAQVDAMRGNLLSTLERDLAASTIAISDLQRMNGESDSRIGQAPSIERRLTALYRNQVIQNQIYAFLLQKREESQLRLAREIPVARVMEDAYSDTKPNGIGGIMMSIILAFMGGVIGLVCLYVMFWYSNREKRLRTLKTDGIGSENMTH